MCAGTFVAVADLIHDVTCVPGAQQGALLLTAEPSNAPAQLVPDSSSSKKKPTKSIACGICVGPAYSCNGTRGANRREAHTFTLPDENQEFCGNKPANELTTCALLWAA